MTCPFWDLVAFSKYDSSGCVDGRVNWRQATWSQTQRKSITLRALREL